MSATIVEGTATVQTAGASSRQQLAQNAALREGDVVQTGADARVEISMGNGSTLRLGHNGTLELRQAPPQGSTFSAHLWVGSLWLKVHKILRDESFQVETENGVAGVRGTEFMIEAGTQAGRTGEQADHKSASGTSAQCSHHYCSWVSCLRSFARTSKGRTCKSTEHGSDNSASARPDYEASLGSTAMIAEFDALQ